MPSECRSSASLVDVVVQALIENASTDIAHTDVDRNLCICPAPGKGGSDLSPGCIFQATAVLCTPCAPRRRPASRGTISPELWCVDMLARQPRLSHESPDSSLVREHGAMWSLMDETPTFLTFNY